MLKKLALLIIVIILGFGIYNVYKNGLELSLFGFEVEALSYEDIKTENTTLNKKIDTLDDLNTKTYKAEVGKLESAKTQFNNSKKRYETLAASASENDIAEANKREEYLLDYLWIKIGNYANANNIKVLIAPTAGIPEIKFDVSGPYISVINFIYDLENDPELNFDVDNIIMEGASSASDTKATFTVTGVNIVTEEQ